MDLTFAKTTEILFDCAIEAVILAFLIQLMGGLMIGLAGGVWQEMTPSLAPPLVSQQENHGSSFSSAFRSSIFREHRFALICGLLFVAKGAGQLVKYSRNAEQRNAAAWMTRVYRRVSAQWFSLVVVNAFAALVAVLVLQIVQQFSLTQWLWRFCFDFFRPIFSAIPSLFPSGSFFEELARLVSWYNSNQFKFTFWLLYSAAICDDLGLPNYKTLGRFIWRRWVRRIA